MCGRLGGCRPGGRKRKRNSTETCKTCFVRLPFAELVHASATCIDTALPALLALVYARIRWKQKELARLLIGDRLSIVSFADRSCLHRQFASDGPDGNHVFYAKRW